MNENDVARAREAFATMTPGQKAIIESMQVSPMHIPGTVIPFGDWWDLNKQRLFKAHPYIDCLSLREIMEEAWNACRANT